MGPSNSNGHDTGTIDLPIIDISELNYDTGKQVLDAFVSITCRMDLSQEVAR